MSDSLSPSRHGHVTWTLEQRGYSTKNGGYSWAQQRGRPLTEAAVALATLRPTLPAAEAIAESSGGTRPQGDQLPPDSGLIAFPSWER